MPQSPNPITTIGFIGLGVMGEPMCGHLARRAGKPILAYDLRSEPLERLASNAVTAALIGAGYDAVNVDGGMRAWAAEDYPVVASDGLPGVVV